jgi:hypothetical protein
MPSQRRPKGARVAKFPDSLAIALWVVGSSWSLAIIAYAFGGSMELIFPLVALGVLTGIAEWLARKRQK